MIAADIGLAYLAGAALQNLGAAPAVVRRAWLALLFNPFVLFVGAAWGQIDAIVALLALAAMLLVAAGRRDLSAVVLALAVCVKPTAAPMLLAALLFVGAGSVPARPALRGRLRRRGTRCSTSSRSSPSAGTSTPAAQPMRSSR